MAFEGIKQVIHKGEGTTDAQAQANGLASGYDVTYSYGKFDPQMKPISQQTVAEVKAYQARLAADPRYPAAAVPVGKYQIIGSTLKEAQKALDIPDNAVMTPALQEKLGDYLIGARRGGNQYLEGQISLDKFQQNLANEWASLPSTSGRSVYGGPIHVNSSELRLAAAGDQSGTTVVPPPTSATAGLTPEEIQAKQAEDDANLIGDDFTPTTQPNSDDRGFGCDPSDNDCVNSEEYSGSNNITTANSVFNKIWGPTPNKFKKFATMTYSVSLYLTSPDQYSRMMATGKKNVQGMELFLQSGGINGEPGIENTYNFGAHRSEFFDLDFYIDDIQFSNFVSGTATGGAHSTFDLKFTVIEPAGLTFLDRLQKMVEAFNKKHGISKHEINYSSMIYLCVVRFYGYDIDGNQISGADLVDEQLSDPLSVAEKYIPFMFHNINFQLSADKVQYNCEAAAAIGLAPMDFVHARIPFNIELQGKTLAEVLGGEILSPLYEDVVKQELDTSTFKPIRGLTALLNEHQQKLVDEGKYSKPDVYEIVFEDGAGIDTAEVIPASTSRLQRSGFPDTIQAEFAYHGKGYYKKSRVFSIQSGMSIVQLIDLLVKTSAFITDQLDQTVDENSRKINMSDKKGKPIIWHKIIPSVELLGFDEKRNDFAYKIRYTIQRNRPTLQDSAYVNTKNNCFGIHKEYDYWFTGENTEVLSFEQNYNLLWFQSIGAHYDPKNLAYQNNIGTIRKTFYQTNSIKSTQGATNRATEGAASIASDLYSPGDQSNIDITIVGDPDLITQGQIFYSPENILNGPYKHSPTLEDGSVNIDSSDVYFAVNYNTIVDYDLNTGLADTQVDNIGRDIATGRPGLVRHSFIYRANIVVTELSGGSFTQTLQGTLLPFPPECVNALKEYTNDELEKQKATTTQVAGQTRSSMKRADPVGAAAGPALFPDNEASRIDLTNADADADELVITNDKALDTPFSLPSAGSVNNNVPPPQLDDYNFNEHLVNSDDSLLGSVRNGVGAVVDTVGRVTKDVFTSVEEAIEDRTPNNIDDFNDGG